MQADKVVVSREEQGGNWLIRIQVGEEVIRRHCNEPKDADQTVLRDAAIKTAAEEGYTVDPANVAFA